MVSIAVQIQLETIKWLMFNYMKTRYIAVLMILYTIPILISNAQDKIKARDKFIWDNFDSTSTIKKDSIRQRDLQGNWISNKVITYGDYEVGLSPQDGQVGALEIKGDKWRNTLSGDFYTFQILQNMIIFDMDHHTDTAYINRITKKELMISYKRDKDFIQYYYRK
jgi:hypothetical protein